MEGVNLIQLYKKGNKNFEMNGNHILNPISCVLQQKINDTWLLTMEYPYEDTDEFSNITVESVLAVPTPDSDKQLYRIYDTVKNDESITAYARPIFLDSAKELILMDVRPTNTTGKAAIPKLFEGQSKYSGSSDITDISTAYYVRKNVMEAIASDDDNSFLNRWGGEIFYDNYSISVNKKIGKDRNVSVEFGRNLDSIEETVDCDSVITRIIPTAFNGYSLLGSKPWVDSELIGKYDIIRTKVIAYDDIKLGEDAGPDDESYSTLTELRNALRQRCREEFENGIDKPAVNYVVNMIDLSETEEYKDYIQLEKVHLGDTVHCKDGRLGIDVDARAISVTYNCITRKNDLIELGNAQANFLDILNSNVDSIMKDLDSTGRIKGESIAGMINLMQTKLQASREIAQKQQERAILFEDNDPNSPTFGAMAIGTTGFQIASRKKNGDWIWSTFGTGEGFMADFIIAGIMYSQNYIQNMQGCKIDLNTGYVEINNGRMNIESSSETDDSFILKYKEWELSLSPLSIELKNKNTGYRSVIQAGGYFLYNSNNELIEYIGESGSRISGNVNIDGNATISGNSSIDGETSLNGKLNIRGSVYAGGNEAVSGTVYDSSGKALIMLDKGIVTHIF